MHRLVQITRERVAAQLSLTWAAHSAHRFPNMEREKATSLRPPPFLG
jgi:hypothetical protein